MSRFRKYLSPVTATLFVLLLAAGAFANPGLQQAADNVPEHVELPQPAEDADQGEVEDEQVETEVAEEAENNHGACVSAAARDDSLSFDEPWKRGMFVSSVAQDEEMLGSECDYSSHAEDAANAEEPGHGDEGPEIEGAEDEGSSFGQSRAEEAKSRGGGKP